MIVMLIEVVLGGSGHFMKVGPLTFRMYLYFTSIPLAVIALWMKGNVEAPVFFWVGAFTILILLAMFLGIIDGASLADLFEDVKPLSFFYVLLFLGVMIQSERDIRIVSGIVKYSCLLMGLAYLFILILFVTGRMHILYFINLVDPYDEVFFRGATGLFFYKGFLYLGIGFLFFVTGKGMLNRLCAVILILATILTLTRGFLLSAISVYVIYLIFIHRNKVVAFIVLAICALIAIVSVPLYFETMGDKSDSDQSRFIQIREVMDRLDWISFFTGKGFGIGIPFRPNHMEISYLEIFHKQGIFGLSFWLGLLFYQTHLYIKLFKKGDSHYEMATPFYLSTIFVYIQSATNPFLNNPIGLSIVLVSLVVLIKFNRISAINPLVIN